MKAKSAKLLLFFELSVLLLAGLNIARGDIIFKNDGAELIAAYAPYISSPSNQTYDSGWLTLYVNFKGLILGMFGFQ